MEEHAQRSNNGRLTLTNLYIFLGLSVLLCIFQTTYIKSKIHQIYVIVPTVFLMFVVLMLIIKSRSDFLSIIARENILVSIIFGCLFSAILFLFSNPLLPTIILGVLIIIGYIIYGLLIDAEIHNLILEEYYNGQGEMITQAKRKSIKQEELWLPSLILALTIYGQTILALYFNGSFS